MGFRAIVPRPAKDPVGQDADRVSTDSGARSAGPSARLGAQFRLSLVVSADRWSSQEHGTARPAASGSRAVAARNCTRIHTANGATGLDHPSPVLSTFPC